MLKHKIVFYLIASISILNASSPTCDDDLLLLSQIGRSSDGTICSVAPLAEQRDGLSAGPKAKWVNAKLYLRNGKAYEELKSTTTWSLLSGGIAD